MIIREQWFYRPSSSCISSHRSCDALGCARNHASNVREEPQDPYPDKPKQLVIHYQDGAGVVHVLVVPDGVQMHFAVDRTPQGLHVIRAIFALASNHGIV